MSISPTALRNNYMALLNSWIDVRREDDALLVRFPFMDAHRDFIEAYVLPTGADSYNVTDFGGLLADLRSDGVVLDDSTRRYTQMLDMATRNGFAVSHDQLTAEVGESDLPKTLHSLAQVFMFAQGLTLGASRERIAADLETLFVKLQERRVEPRKNVRVRGQSGLEHLFQLRWIADKHDVLARLVHRATRDSASLFAFSIRDVREATSGRVGAVAFIPPDVRGIHSFTRVASAFDIRVVTLDRWTDALDDAA